MPNGKYEHCYYPDPADIEYLMGLWFGDFEKLEKLESFDSYVETYTKMHLSFSSVHPFFDGNGRLARLVANIPLLKNGFLPIIIDNNEREEYINLLANYNLATKPLDKYSQKLIEQNEEYRNLATFFKRQYKNSQKLLDELKEVK